MLISKFAGLEIKSTCDTIVTSLLRKLLFGPRQEQAQTSPKNATIGSSHEVTRIWIFFKKNSDFIDEAGFHTNMKTNRAWAPKGQMAAITAPITKTRTHTILGAMSFVGVVILEYSCTKATSWKEGSKVTTAGHCLRFKKKVLLSAQEEPSALSPNVLLSL